MSNTDSESKLPRAARSPIALEDCGLSATAELLGDRWTLLILRSVFYGVRRFADIKEDIAVPGSTLSSRIRRLLDAGLLEEHPYRDGNARTRNEYCLTPAGESLQTVLMALMAWGDRYLRNEPSKLAAVTRNGREELRLAFVDKTGRAVDAADIDFALRP
ncbi:MAG: helix-turn-helix domain-containing protein [Pseudomonadota bacterium]